MIVNGLSPVPVGTHNPLGFVVKVGCNGAAPTVWGTHVVPVTACVGASTGRTPPSQGLALPIQQLKLIEAEDAGVKVTELLSAE